MKFLSNVLANILGFFIAIFLIFIFFIGIAAAIGGSITADSEIVVKTNSVLELDFSSKIKDYAPISSDPFEEVLNINEDLLGLNKIINAIKNASSDDNIKGISIKNNVFVNAGIAQTQAIRDALKNFKESGKFIYAYNDFYDQKNYYLSSVADSLFLNPVGSIDIKGLSTEILYFKDFEDKYGVKMEIIRHGKFKSAVEPFLENKMSEANREQTESFLNSIWSKMASDISKSRNITFNNINQIADNSFGRNSTIAKENNLIDGAIYIDEYETKLKSVLETKKINYVSINDYINSGKGRITSTSKNKIAVIYAQGDIMYGKGDENTIGQGIINKAIRKATKSKNVKAIVLRVNSPGGSALASELIWRELELAKKEKPLVVSMGNYAASGGYYISCNADKIFAEPTTITGSIGVFGMIPNAYELTKRMGINAEQVSTNKNPSYSVFEPMNKRFYEVTKEGVEIVYNTFVKKVAKGRNITFEKANSVAQGRVWSGSEALEKGLVDNLGNLEDAIEAAASLADIEDYKIKNYPNYKKDFKEVLKNFPFVSTFKEKIIKQTLGDENYSLFKTINQIKETKGIQTKMPFVLEIK